VRSAGLYLDRNRYLNTVKRIKNTLPLEKDKGLNDLKASLEKARSLDPYSPRTDYLLAGINSLAGDYEKALASVDEAIERMRNFEEFAFTGIDWNDLYGRKARVAKGLGQWEVAIEYMKKRCRKWTGASYLMSISISTWRQGIKKTSRRPF